MKRIAFTLVLFFCLAVSTIAGERITATVTARVTRIIDGDTFEVFDGESEFRVRLIGVDAPESRRNPKAERDAEEWGVLVEDIVREGRKAAAFVRAFAPPGLAVWIVENGEDAYGRILAYVYLPDDRCLNEIILRAGCALTPERYRHERRSKFAEIERGARIQKRGFWKTIWRNKK
jgi:micrococcal nuclease